MSDQDTSIQVIEGHGCAGLVCLYYEVAFYLSQDRHVEQAIQEKALIVSEVRHHDLQKVVRLTGDKMEGYHLWHGAYGCHEVVGTLARMTLYLRANKCRDAETRPIAAEHGAIAFDNPFLF